MTLEPIDGNGKGVATVRRFDGSARCDEVLDKARDEVIHSTVMRSPFPGMDPWLELRWRDVQASIVVYIRNQLQRQLPDSLVARADRRIGMSSWTFKL